MAAISAALGVLLKSGDTVVAHKTVYGCTWSLFTNWYPRLGIKVIFADLTVPENLEKLIAADENMFSQRDKKEQLWRPQCGGSFQFMLISPNNRCNPHFFVELTLFSTVFLKAIERRRSFSAVFPHFLCILIP